MACGHGGQIKTTKARSIEPVKLKRLAHLHVNSTQWHRSTPYEQYKRLVDIDAGDETLISIHDTNWVVLFLSYSFRFLIAAVIKGEDSKRKPVVIETLHTFVSPLNILLIPYTLFL